MTPEQFQQARQKLGLEAPDLARMLAISESRATQTFSDWKCGRSQMDEARARLLTLYLRLADEAPHLLPEDWPYRAA